MLTIAELKNILPQEGILDHIVIRPEKRGEVISVDQVAVDTQDGLEGDHYGKSGGKRMISLIQKEHLDMIAKWFNLEDIEHLTRRNLVISDINLLSLVDREILIGEDVILKITGHCHPCSRMETNLGPGGYNAMRGHGGLTARVIRGGKIRIGDIVKTLIGV